MGVFVRVKDSRYAVLGIGKIEHLKHGYAQISFFDSPITRPIVVEVPVGVVKQVTLPRQTRVYWQDEADAAWRVGRVLDADDEIAEVRFPNKEDHLLRLGDLHVRWDRPIVDPTVYIAHQITETPSK